MDFGKFAEKWKNRPKINFSDFLQDFWREKMDFGKFDENWKNRPKIIFLDFLWDFWREKWTLENLLKIEKIAQKSFFVLSAGFLKGKMDFRKFAENWKNGQKIIVHGSAKRIFLRFVHLSARNKNKFSSSCANAIALLHHLIDNVPRSPLRDENPGPVSRNLWGSGSRLAHWVPG